MSSPCVARLAKYLSSCIPLGVMITRNEARIEPLHLDRDVEGRKMKVEPRFDLSAPIKENDLLPSG